MWIQLVRHMTGYGAACYWLMITMKIMMLHSCGVKYIKIWLFFMYFLSVNLKNMQFLPKCNFVCHFLLVFFFFFFRFNYILFLCFIEKLCCLSKMLKGILSEMNEWRKIVTRNLISSNSNSNNNSNNRESNSNNIKMKTVAH